tara:strand:+ start:303 stop:803 length:501 start_codon:yes stop_codon:yes gene_type:complete
MEIKKSKVKSNQASGSLDLSHGTFFKFEISFEDGTVGEYLSKTQDGGNKNFPIGMEKEFEVTDNKYGKKIKPHFAQKSFTPQASGTSTNPDIQRMIVKQSSLKVAADVCIANNKTDLNTIFKTANTIVEWVMDDKSVKPKPIAQKQFEESTTDTYHKPSEANDLPF